MPVLRAGLAQDAAIRRLQGRRILAFAGIALPEKFFAPLRAAGADVVAALPFPDHHFYTVRELDSLRRQALALNAALVTTPKDAVRLPPTMRSLVTVIGVGLVWEDPDEIERVLDAVMDGAGLLTND
jgi:tetraacyldisaccharide 4'-kinase